MTDSEEATRRYFAWRAKNPSMPEVHFKVWESIWKDGGGYALARSAEIAGAAYRFERLATYFFDKQMQEEQDLAEVQAEADTVSKYWR